MLPVPLNSSKITSSIRLPVSTSAVAMMVSDPPPSMFRAAPKNRFGFCSALASTPPERILPECGTTTLWARARRVIESSRMTTSRPCSTSRFAFSMTMSATCTWRSAGSSKVEEMTSAFTFSSMSVTSSGRSSMSSTMSTTSGWFSLMALASFWRRMVLPAFGGATIRPRWPLPIGERRSTTRIARSPVLCSSRIRLSGYLGRRLSNAIRCLVFSGSSKLTLSTLSSARYRSPSFGGRTWPMTVSPVRRSKRLIWLGET